MQFQSARSGRMKAQKSYSHRDSLKPMQDGRTCFMQCRMFWEHHKWRFPTSHSSSIPNLDLDPIRATQRELVRLRSPLDIDLRAGDSECRVSDLSPNPLSANLVCIIVAVFRKTIQSTHRSIDIPNRLLEVLHGNLLLLPRFSAGRKIEHLKEDFGAWAHTAVTPSGSAEFAGWLFSISPSTCAQANQQQLFG